MATAHLFLDQIEGELAVLSEQGGEGQEEGQEHIIPLAALPVGVQEGNWLAVEIPTDDTVFSYFAAAQEGREKWPDFTVDEAMEKAAKQQAQALMDELSG